MNYYSKYFKYKNKYFALKQKYMKGGSCSSPYYEHSVSFKLIAFLNILETGFIYSPSTIISSKLGTISHESPTGGMDYISVSIPGTYTSNKYSRNGITFIFKSDGLVCGSDKRKEDGEEHIKDKIDLRSNLVAVYIPPEVEDIIMQNLPLCGLQYGTRTFQDKLTDFYPLEEIAKISEEYNRIYNYNPFQGKTLYKNIVGNIYNPSIHFRTEDISSMRLEKEKLLNDFYQKINIDCSIKLLTSVTERLGLSIDVLKTMKLQDFVNGTLARYGYSIKVTNSLSI
jgi:hypothetical protein